MPTKTTEYGQAAQEQTLKTIRQGQQAVVEAVKSWAEVVEKTASEPPTILNAEEFPTPQELLQSGFKFADQLLKAQREFAEGILTAVTPVLEKTTSGKA